MAPALTMEVFAWRTTLQVKEDTEKVAEVGVAMAVEVVTNAWP
jgi:hypothetical protein